MQPFFRYFPLRFCSRAKYLLKVDDDVFIQLPRLYHLLNSLDRSPLHSNKSIILGNVASGWKPVRNLESKYYISPKQYDETHYPPFVTGPSYVVSKRAMQGKNSNHYNVVANYEQYICQNSPMLRCCSFPLLTQPFSKSAGGSPTSH